MPMGLDINSMGINLYVYPKNARNDMEEEHQFFQEMILHHCGAWSYLFGLILWLNSIWVLVLERAKSLIIWRVEESTTLELHPQGH